MLMELTFVLPETTKKQTLRDLLEKEWLIPRKVRYFLRTRKNITLNGEIAMFQQEVQSGDTLHLIFEEEDYVTPRIKMGDSTLIRPLWEDAHLLIVNKPAGQKTHPNQPNEDGTLINDVAAYLAQKNQTPYVVHRLDKETSGAILFAKNPIVLPILGKILEKKEIYRIYEAQVQGHLLQNNQIISKKIGRDPSDQRKRIIDEKEGKTAITHVHLLRKETYTSWVECSLETGRTHQIRVHLASVGSPIIGDPLYHPKGINQPRLQLHAKELSLIHPFTKEKIIAKSAPYLSD